MASLVRVRRRTKGEAEPQKRKHKPAEQRAHKQRRTGEAGSTKKAIAGAEGKGGREEEEEGEAGLGGLLAAYGEDDD